MKNNTNSEKEKKPNKKPSQNQKKNPSSGLKYKESHCYMELWIHL